MAPNQRRAAIIIGSVLLLGVGRFLLFMMLIKQPEDIATNIQTQLQEQNEGTPQNSSPSQDDQLGVSGETNEGMVDGNTNTSLPDPFPLSILLPPRVQQDAINELISRIDPQGSFTHTLIQPPNMRTYLRAIEAMSQGTARQVDIILLPRSEITRLDTWAARVNRTTPPPVGLFHPQVGNLINALQTTFIPHALDPRVMVTTMSVQQLSLGAFLQQFQSPLLVNSTTDLQDPMLMMLMALWLDQLVLVGKSELVNKVLAFHEGTSCLFSIECLRDQHLAPGQKQSVWMPLSGVAPDQQEDLYINALPTHNRTLPTTVRGRVVRGNDSVAATTKRLERIQSYLRIMSQDLLPYEQPLLPTYHPRLQRLLLQEQRRRIKTPIYQLRIIQDTFPQIQQRFADLPVSGVLDGSHHPALYLEKRQQIRTTK